MKAKNQFDGVKLSKMVAKPEEAWECDHCKRSFQQGFGMTVPPKPEEDATKITNPGIWFCISCAWNLINAIRKILEWWTKS